MQTITIYFKEIERRLLVPFYIYKKRAQCYKLKLGDLIKDITNGIDLRDFIEEGSLYFRIIDIKRGQMNILTAKRVSKTIKDIQTKIIIHQNDILISRKGTPGIACLATELEEQNIIGTEIIKINLKPNAGVSPEVLMCFLNTKVGFTQIISKLTGSVSRGINHPALKSIKIPLFSKKLQFEVSKIIKQAVKYHVSSLNKINKAKQIFKEEINIHHINEEKTYLVNSRNLKNIFTPKFYYPKYLNTVNELKRKFETIKLGDISNICRGNEVGSENYKKYINKKEIDIPFIRTSDIVNYEIDNYPDYYINKEIYDNLNQDINEGDIIYTKDGKIGLTALIISEDKCILASGISRLRIKKDISPYYVFLVLSTNIGLYQALQRTVIAATIPHLQSERLSEIEIPLIDSQKQKEISCLVEEAFKLKAEKKKLIKKAMDKIENFVIQKY